MLHLLALNREVATEIALGVLAATALTVSAGAWILLWRERRAGPDRRSRPESRS